MFKMIIEDNNSTTNVPGPKHTHSLMQICKFEPKISTLSK